jgi:chromosome segregation ATPase
MAGKDNTTRIEILESQAANVSGRLAVFDFQLKVISDLLKKYSEASEGHGSKITVIEQQLLVLADLKPLVGSITALEKELVAIKKDLEAFGKWRDEQKREREEFTRRKWAFGPNITAAIIGGLMSLGTALLVLKLKGP